MKTTVDRWPDCTACGHELHYQQCSCGCINIATDMGGGGSGHSSSVSISSGARGGSGSSAGGSSISRVASTGLLDSFRNVAPKEKWRFMGREVPKNTNSAVDGLQCYRWECRNPSDKRYHTMVYVISVQQFWSNR